jgi:hypothetical protein
MHIVPSDGCKHGNNGIEVWRDNFKYYNYMGLLSIEVFMAYLTLLSASETMQRRKVG